jgi:Bacteriocin-protection, YdeI or OmpD-Associated/Domain of unknown function (DUF1905)
MKFRATLELHGKTATGITVPPAIVEGLNGGQRPAVTVTLKGHSYRTTIAPMGGVHLIPVSAEHREAAGLSAGDTVEVTVELDTAPRTVEVPDDLARALAAAPVAAQAFDALSTSNKKAHVLSVEGAKTAETRERRIAKVVTTLGG